MEKCLSKVVTVRSFVVGEVRERQELKDKKQSCTENEVFLIQYCHQFY